MYTAGKLIYFNPFYFHDGSSKAKYFLVLKVLDETVILASLPSSKIHLPPSHEISHGCLDMPESGINCYIFEANRAITKCGWSFELNTILYGMWLDIYSIATLQSNHSIEGVDFEVIGELTDQELQNIINCFKNSSTVKRKFKRILNA